jgi:uncharacterized membrane protein
MNFRRISAQQFSSVPKPVRGVAMEEAGHEEPDEDIVDHPEPETFQFGNASRPSMGVAAVALIMLSVWMLWIDHKYAKGGGPFELIVAVVIGELTLSIGLFASVLLIWAMFAPAWLSRVLQAAHDKLAWAIVATGVILTLVIPALALLRILQ